jgi:thiol-disulfide isomerase/thioredoxin
MEQVAPDARSHEVSFAELLHEPTIVLFMGEHCGPCRELARDLANAEPAIAAAPLFVIIGEHDRTDGWLPEGVSVFRDAGAAARAFANIATPHGYLVDERGVIRGKRVVQSLTDLRALLRARELVEV